MKIADRRGAAHKNDEAGDSLASVLTAEVPICRPDSSRKEVIRAMLARAWAPLNYVFVVDDAKRLKGMIALSQLLAEDDGVTAGSIAAKVGALRAEDDKGKAVRYAIKYDTDIIPVVDAEDRFLGAVVSKSLIDIMHQEHLEQMFYRSGIYGRSQATKLIAAGAVEVVKARLPWLILGLIAGLALGLMSRYFEHLLEKNIALAFFIPVVAYIADSVGTQSEAIAVRAIAVLKINSAIYLIREFIIGLLVGAVIGIAGGLGAALISGDHLIGLVVGSSLLVASTIASVLAAAFPIFFKMMKRDPALGSGPLATAIQDVLSIFIYFVFAVLLL